MLDVVKYTQQVVLRNASPTITPILTSLFTEIAKEVAAKKDWRCLRRDHTIDLETNVEDYVVSGDDNNLDKIVSMYYGDDEAEVIEYDEDEFRRRVLGNVSGETPYCFYAKGRPNEYSWSVRIYPCSATSFDTLGYSFQKKIKPVDALLFSDPMVFVNGMLWRWFTDREDYDRAHDYNVAYYAGLKNLMFHDRPTLRPRGKFTPSDERLRFLGGKETLRQLRRR